MYNHSKFAMYLVYHGRLGFWHKICHMRIHAPSIWAGVHAISKTTGRSFPFYDSRCVPSYLLFFPMLLLLSYFWQIYKCIKMQLDSFIWWKIIICGYTICAVVEILSKPPICIHIHSCTQTHKWTYTQSYLYLRPFSLVLLTMIKKMFVYIWYHNSWIKCLL